MIMALNIAFASQMPTVWNECRCPEAKYRTRAASEDNNNCGGCDCNNKKDKSSTSDKRNDCPCDFQYISGNAAGAILNSKSTVPKDNAASLYQFLPELYNTSDWTLKIIRPPVC